MLNEKTISFAAKVLPTGGKLVMKTFANAAEDGATMLDRKGFKKIRRVKPAASRKESAELFFVAERRRRPLEKERDDT